MMRRGRRGGGRISREVGGREEGKREREDKNMEKYLIVCDNSIVNM